MERSRVPWGGLLFLALAVASGPAWAQSDPYENYVLTSKDFQAVPQGKDWAYTAFPSWSYMPWPYQWGIGYTATSGQWAAQHGYNGFTVLGADTSALPWITANGMGFYVDHAGGKGNLYLNAVSFTSTQLRGTGVRPLPVNANMVATIQSIMNTRIGNVRNSPLRQAYDLDDEISWGSFVRPCMWQATDDWNAYQNWLVGIYGTGNAPTRTNWISYENVRGNLSTWSIKTFDASQLMDQWTFNDSYWLNTIGDLVAYSNQLDPRTPCGITGGQGASPFGGYDYAKLMRKVQYIESYDQGQSNSLIRSFNPQNALPSVTTHFFTSTADAIWRSWYYLAHGNRGQIGWVTSGTGNANWFNGSTPAAWHDQVASTYNEVNDRIGPLVAKAEWRGDGVALLYNQASIQLQWILDAQSHGSTWPNRNGDNRLGSSSLGRQAWENMLRDEGLQYDYLDYASVIQGGIPSKYKVLVLPAALALSDAEARRIKEFCANGGTVIADYLPGLWDQHGKGRTAGGVLDDMFGVAQDPNMKAADIFGTGLWAETNQDLNYYYTDYQTLLTNGNSSIKDASGFDKAARNLGTNFVHAYGSGTAVLLNLSPQWYNAYRNVSYSEAAARRQTFMAPLHNAGLNRWVWIQNADAATFGYEITYWDQGDRTLLFLTFNPEQIVSSSVVGLRSTTVPITLAFGLDIVDLRDERTSQALGGGRQFAFTWTEDEALVLSCYGLGRLPGDANRDGRVDVSDLAILAGHYAAPGGMAWAQGDFTGEGAVDVSDLAVLAGHYGAFGGQAPAPEPATLALLAAGWLTLLNGARRPVQ